LDTHGRESVSLSFNGGKDCTVLLHLYTAAIAHRLPECEPMKPIPTLYIPAPSAFTTMEEFIADAAVTYNLNLFSCRDLEPQVSTSANRTDLNSTTGSVGKAKGSGMREGLQLYKDCFPETTAILMGTRRTDPHGPNLSHRNMTDPGWPSFERVNPIINWSYCDIWEFLRRLNVPYCKLYDQGYTSLGSTYNTFPNPALLITSSSSHSEADVLTPTLINCPRYKPAYELHDGSLERSGRGITQPTGIL
jgi:FAD synthetase